MIVNTTPGAVDWNKAVNEINITTHEQYRIIDRNVSTIERSVAAVYAANDELKKKQRILTNKLEFLKLFVEAYK